MMSTRTKYSSSKSSFTKVNPPEAHSLRNLATDTISIKKAKKIENFLKMSNNKYDHLSKPILSSLK